MSGLPHENLRSLEMIFLVIGEQLDWVGRSLRLSRLSRLREPPSLEHFGELVTRRPAKWII